VAVERGSTNQPGILELSQRLILLQEIIQRYRRARRFKATMLVLTFVLLAAAAVLWYTAPQPVRISLPSGVLVLALAALAAWTVALRRPLLSTRELEFLEFTKRDASTLADLELNMALLRERRRSHPGLASVDHKTQYQDDIYYYVEELRSRGVRSRKANNTTQIITIVGSLAATGLGGLAISIDSLALISPIITFIVGTASGVAAIYKFKDRSFYAQQTANAIDQEVDAYNLRIGRYKPSGTSAGEGVRLQAILLEEVHRLRTEQENREQNLDQPTQKSTSSE
jgi:hypothetical protein